MSRPSPDNIEYFYFIFKKFNCKRQEFFHRNFTNKSFFLHFRSLKFYVGELLLHFLVIAFTYINWLKISGQLKKKFEKRFHPC